MSFYSQWVKERKLYPVMWVCGPEQILVREVVDYVKGTAHNTLLNFTLLDAAQLSMAQLCDHLEQRPIVEDCSSFTLVQNSEHIIDFTRIKSWLSDFKTRFPQATVCFESASDDAPDVDFFKPPKAAVVRCARLSPEDAVRWVKTQAPISERSARLLLNHVAGSLGDAYQVCSKIKRSVDPLSLLVLTPEQIAAFTVETPSDFVDAVMSLDKPRALTAVSLLSDEERYRSVSILDTRLSQLTKLQGLLRLKKTGQELSKIPGLPYPVVKDLLPISRFYNNSRILTCRQHLTVTDHYHNQGIYSGVLEALVSVW